MTSRRKLKGLVVRKAVIEDIPEVYRCQLDVYTGLAEETLCSERLLYLQLAAFPEGFAIAEYEGRIVGYSTCLIVQLDADSPWYSYAEITGGGAFTTHAPSADTLYGADIGVHPDYRGRGVASALYRERKKLLRRLNLRRMVAGGRIPGYESVAEKVTPQEYVEGVIAGKFVDSSLNAHLRAGYSVRGVHHGYLEDEQSLNYATFLEYENPYFKSERHRISASPLKRRHRRVRLCLAQRDLGTNRNFGQLLESVEQLLIEAEILESHLVMLPDGWTHGIDHDEMLDRAEELETFFKEQCVSRGLLIGCGAYPDRSYSQAAALFGPEGLCGRQPQLHQPQGERQKLPDDLVVFDTSLARIGMLSGYDAVFPELTRRLTLAGMQLLLVSARPRERNEYLRLKHCAQARAVENTIYVALCKGTEYGESILFTPCDFGFPDSGVAARAGTSGPALVVHDLDLGSLESARELGSIRPLTDRRTDLCGLHAAMKVRTVKL